MTGATSGAETAYPPRAPEWRKRNASHATFEVVLLELLLFFAYKTN
jgi:hypothetical protein